MDILESTAFTSLVLGLLKQHKIPGLSIAIVHGNDTSSKGFGMADLEASIPCTADTLFDVASCAKSLTAAAVGLLVDDETYPDVRYEALMSQLLPEDFLMQEKAHTYGITVEDILSHRTGMASHDSSYMGIKATLPDDARSITRNLRNLKVAAPLRSRYLYCNQMFTVATYLVEKTSNMSFSQFLSDRLFKPLQMHSTTLQPSSAVANGWGNKIAKGYVHENKEWRSFEPQNCPEGQGAGSIISSANDFIKWIKALLRHEGPINDKVYHGLIKMRSIVNPHARRLRAHTTPANYAAGLEIYFYREKMVVGHDGNVPGFSSRFIFMPDMGFGAVILGNSSGAGGAATTIMRALMDDVLGVDFQDRPYYHNNRSSKDLKEEKSFEPLSKQLTQHQKEAQSGSLDTHPQRPSETETFTKQKETINENDRKKQYLTSNKRCDRTMPKPKGAKAQRGPKTSNIPLPQITPLELYLGEYWNAGYHTMAVQIKNDQLFVDATDRSMGFTITFEHIENQTRYIAHLRDDFSPEDDNVAAEFVFEDGKTVRMGLDLEPAIKEMIWFQRDAGM